MIALAKYIMRGRLQAMIVAFSLALLSLILPPVSIVSSAAVALVTLRRGAYEGFYVLACSGLIAALLGIVLLGGGYQFALTYVSVLWLPIWLVSIALRTSQKLAWAIELAILLGIIGVIGFYAYNSPVDVFWKSLFIQMIPDNAPVADVTRMIETLAPYMTGIVAAGSVFGWLFSLFLARWWQANLYNPDGFRQEFFNLEASTRLAIGSAVVVIAAGLSEGTFAQILWNITILAFVLYSLVGTAVLHVVCAKMTYARYSVPLLYITLFLVPHALLPVALVGLSDPWLNLRKLKRHII